MIYFHFDTSHIVYSPNPNFFIQIYDKLNNLLGDTDIVFTALDAYSNTKLLNL